MNRGFVHLIGTGPGDRGLLTIKAMEAISSADVIVYDRLASPETLEFVRDDAEIIYVGKRPGYHHVVQEDINSILVEHSSKGKRVARVKGGDPFVFGRGGEEAQALSRKSIPFEVIPGISSSIAAAEYAGIPVTHRKCSSSIHVMTGHEKGSSGVLTIDFSLISRLEGTLVFLMGVGNMREIMDGLLAGGKDGATPVAVIEQATTSKQRTVTGTIMTIAAIAAERSVKSPAVIVIGECVNLRDEISWFEGRKLLGCKVVIPVSGVSCGDNVAEGLRRMGADVFELRTRVCEPVWSQETASSVCDGLPGMDASCFYDGESVIQFLELLASRMVDIRSLSAVRLIAMTESASGELRKRGMIPDAVVDGWDGLMGYADVNSPCKIAVFAPEEEAPGTGNSNGYDGLSIVRLHRESQRTSVMKAALGSLVDREYGHVILKGPREANDFFGSEGACADPSRFRVICVGNGTKSALGRLGIECGNVISDYTLENASQELSLMVEQLKDI